MSTDRFTRHYGFLRTACSKKEDTEAVRAVFERNLGAKLDNFYAHIAKNDELSHHIKHDGFVEQLKKAQSNHWARVFADQIGDDFTKYSDRIGQTHAELGLSSSWYMGAYAWVLIGLMKPLVGAYCLRPGKLVAVLETLLTRSFFDMIASTASYEEGLSKIRGNEEKQESNIRSLKNLAGTVSDVNEVAVELAYLANNSRDLNANAQTIASAVTEMVASVDDIARSSKGAVVDAQETDVTVSEGRVAVEQVNEAIANIARAVEETAASVDDLSRASEQIGQILGVIETIASQTNLLALNATIEAARAGEAGRGFAVVAAEVKGLSNQTSRATEDISSRIGSLRDGMALIQKTMQHSKSAVVQGQQAIVDAGRNMDAITSRIARVGDKMRDISQILEQQTAATAEIGKSVGLVASTAEENEVLLGRMSGKLHESNDRFSANAKSWFDADSHRALVEMAKIDHVLFKKRVVDVLMGRGEWKPAEVPDHHVCRLGKWYDAVQIPKIRSDATFSALVEPHKAVHAHARRALEAHEAKKSAEAMDALSAMNAASEQVLSGLTKLSDFLFSDVATLDRRRQERVTAKGDVRASVGGVERMLKMKDISREGARVEGLTSADVGKEVRLLHEDACCSATAMWSNDKEGGMKFLRRPTSGQIRQFIAE